MGSGESRTRKVSFGVDDEDRVRILRGVKLSEDVLQRMKGVANIAPERTPSATSSAQKDRGASNSTGSSPQPQKSSQQRAQPSTPPKSPPKTPPKTTSSAQSSTSRPDPKDEQRRFERMQAMVKDELAKAAQKEKAALRQEVTKAMVQERQQARQEGQRAKLVSPEEIEVMAQQLQKKDAQLKALDAFYKEQLAEMERKNSERYEQSKDQFHQAASKTEEIVRPRSTDPVCTGLQAQILSCFKENKDQTLTCSDLAKAYMRCIDTAKKNQQVNHG